MTKLSLYTDSRKRKRQDEKYDYETKVAESKRKKKRLESEKEGKEEIHNCSKCGKEGHKNSRSKECEYHNKTMDEVMEEKLGNGFERCTRKAHLSSVIRPQ
jgi:hypothetical protein